MDDGGTRSFRPEVMAAAGFPTISFDDLEVGTEFRSDDRLIRPQDIEAYAFMTGDDDDLFFEPGPFGPPVAHPTLLANQALFLRHTRFFVPAGLHARMTFEFRQPARLGTRARTTGRVVDRYLRRDKPYMVTEFITADDAGTVLTTGRFVQMLFRDATAPPPGSGQPPEPEPPMLDSSITTAQGRRGTLAAGQHLIGPTRTVGQRQIDAYSGVRPGSIHTDEGWATAKGFPTTIAQGMMSTAYVSALLTGELGAGFVAGGSMDVRFLRPVHQGDRLTTTGVIQGFAGFEGDPGRVRVVVDVEITNQRGERTLAGMASGLAMAS